MRTNYRHKRAGVKEGGGHWLSFSDMMSVLVLIFIFVVFSMLSTLAQEEGEIENMELEYNARIDELNASLDAVSQALAESKAQNAQIIVLTSDLESANALLVETQAKLDTANAKLASQAETERTVIDLRNRLTTAEAALSAALDETRDQASVITSLDAKLKQAEQEAKNNEHIILISSLQAQLSDAEAAILALNGDNKALSTQNEALDKANSALAAEKRALNSELADAKAAISATKAELASAQSSLSETSAKLANKQTELSDARAEIMKTQNALDEAQSALVSALSDVKSKDSQLSEYQKLLEQRQGELEQMIGVKAEIIEQLSSELSKQNIAVQVDAQTGAIALPGGMLFDVGKNELSREGKEYLDKFLPIYLNVLMSNRFEGYVAEIIIEGHTDTTGKAGMDAYLYNLDLSQQRALSVSNYVLATDYMSSKLGLNAAKQSALRKLITSSGRSYSAIVYSGGAEDKEASRRVEIKFRLSDEETIAKMEALLRLMESN